MESNKFMEIYYNQIYFRFGVIGEFVGISNNKEICYVYKIEK